MKTKTLHILIALVVGAFLFYWFQMRPIQIRKGCHQWVVESKDIEDGDLYGEGGRLFYNALYQSCLHREGLK